MSSVFALLFASPFVPNDESNDPNEVARGTIPSIVSNKSSICRIHFIVDFHSMKLSGPTNMTSFDTMESIVPIVSGFYCPS